MRVAVFVLIIIVVIAIIIVMNKDAIMKAFKKEKPVTETDDEDTETDDEDTETDDEDTETDDEDTETDDEDTKPGNHWSGNGKNTQNTEDDTEIQIVSPKSKAQDSQKMENQDNASSKPKVGAGGVFKTK